MDQPFLGMELVLQYLQIHNVGMGLGLLGVRVVQQYLSQLLVGIIPQFYGINYAQ